VEEDQKNIRLQITQQKRDSQLNYELWIMDYGLWINYQRF
jgi:hypothetical protein